MKRLFATTLLISLSLGAGLFEACASHSAQPRSSADYYIPALMLQQWGNNWDARYTHQPATTTCWKLGWTITCQ